MARSSSNLTSARSRSTDGEVVIHGNGPEQRLDGPAIAQRLERRPVLFPRSFLSNSSSAASIS